MKRRALIASAGAASVAPLVAPAQQATMPVIGLLGSASPTTWASRLRAFHQGLAEAGFVNGRNVSIVYRWADGHAASLAGFAADLVRQKVDVIVVLGGSVALLEARAATTSIPIVFRNAIDPVGAGIVASMSRPGSNLTGVTNYGYAAVQKQIQFLREVLPAIRHIAMLTNPDNRIGPASIAGDVAGVVRELGLALDTVQAKSAAEAQAVVADLARRRIEGLVVIPDVLFNTISEELAVTTRRHALPAISAYREFTEAGGLMSYGGGINESCRLVGTYVGRVLKGEKPANIPVLHVDQLELVINLQTAKALGIAVPQAMLTRADEVID